MNGIFTELNLHEQLIPKLHRIWSSRFQYLPIMRIICVWRGWMWPLMNELQFLYSGLNKFDLLDLFFICRLFRIKICIELLFVFLVLFVFRYLFWKVKLIVEHMKFSKASPLINHVIRKLSFAIDIDRIVYSNWKHWWD